MEIRQRFWKFLTEKFYRKVFYEISRNFDATYYIARRSIAIARESLLTTRIWLQNVTRDKFQDLKIRARRSRLRFKRNFLRHFLSKKIFSPASFFTFLKLACTVNTGLFKVTSHFSYSVLLNSKSLSKPYSFSLLPASRCRPQKLRCVESRARAEPQIGGDLDSSLPSSVNSIPHL